MQWIQNLWPCRQELWHMQSTAYCLMQIRPCPICSPLQSSHVLVTFSWFMCKLFSVNNSWLNQDNTSAACILFSSATLQAVVAENRVKFRLCLPCCISMTAYIVVNPPPTHTHWRSEKCKRTLLGYKHTQCQTHVHIMTLLHAAQTNWQECTRTGKRSCCSTIRCVCYNGVVWMGSNNGALWHLNQARWRVSQEAE